jgi:hypothetical protein
VLPAHDGGVSVKSIQAILLSHFLLGALFSYNLARSFRLSPAASALTGIVFVLGGFVFPMYGYVHTFCGFMWMPLVALACANPWPRRLVGSKCCG